MDKMKKLKELANSSPFPSEDKIISELKRSVEVNDRLFVDVRLWTEERMCSVLGSAENKTTVYLLRPAQSAAWLHKTQLPHIVYVLLDGGSASCFSIPGGEMPSKRVIANWLNPEWKSEDYKCISCWEQFGTTLCGSPRFHQCGAMTCLRCVVGLMIQSQSVTEFDISYECPNCRGKIGSCDSLLAFFAAMKELSPLTLEGFSDEQCAFIKDWTTFDGSADFCVETSVYSALNAITEGDMAALAINAKVGAFERLLSGDATEEQIQADTERVIWDKMLEVLGKKSVVVSLKETKGTIEREMAKIGSGDSLDSAMSAMNAMGLMSSILSNIKTLVSQRSDASDCGEPAIIPSQPKSAHSGCAKCGKAFWDKRAKRNAPTCKHCQKMKYCSVHCRNAHSREHRPVCVPKKVQRKLDKRRRKPQKKRGRKKRK